MQFNSYIFIMIYIPILILGYFSLNKIGTIYGKVFMLIASSLFYIYGGWKNSLILLASIVINLAASTAINKSSRCRKALLILAISANILLLLYFKYFNFLVSNINLAFGRDYSLIELILPLGISFFTFQQIMYVVNVYESQICNISIIDYLLYILYFPKILMGPLVKPDTLIQQLNDNCRKSINWDNISYGLKLFSYGLFKKTILADTFAIAVNWGYSNIDVATSMDWFLVMLSYTFEIYFDFSGYSDMAISISKMLNIDLPINFDSPYKALSIRDFWKRWHISLTNFLTKYIYIPLGGNKNGKLRTYFNTLVVFLISGIWHGANWTFILWGTLHGMLSIIDRVLSKWEKNIIEIVRWCITFIIVNILWLLFRSDTITQWQSILTKIFTFKDTSVSDGLINSFVLPETSFLFNILHLNSINTAIRGFSMLIFMAFSFGVCLIPENNYKRQTHNNWLTMLISACIFVWCFLCLSSESVFVYFNF